MENKRPLTRETGTILRRYALKPKKSLGQNFITDSHVLEKMIAAAQLDKQTGVLEIGPGIGALTERLAQSAGRVLAVEIDRRLISLLKETFAHTDNVYIEQGDILAVDVDKLMATYFQECRRTVVVANLPYYITSAVIMRLLELNWPFASYVYMLQKEVGERIAAKPGNKHYGLLSIAVQFYARPERVARVPAHVFIPRPRVDSVIIRLQPHEKPPVDVRSVEHFFRVARAGFKERRKTVTNNLKAHLLVEWEKQEIRAWLSRLGIDPNARVETLALDELAVISNAYGQLKMLRRTGGARS